MIPAPLDLRPLAHPTNEKPAQPYEGDARAFEDTTVKNTTTPPSADDLAYPMERFTYPDGFTFERLRPYWQQHPGLSESPVTFWEKPLNMAWWRDGVSAAVPANADAKTLMKYYLTAHIIAELEGHTLSPRNVPRGGGR